MSKRLVKLLSRLNKKDIIKLAKMKCKCGHSYLEHISCAFKDKVILETEDGKVIVMEEKMGFLDIESSNLQADFGVVFSYCIKELDGELIANVVKPHEIRKGIYDKRLMKDFCRDVRKFDRIITFYGSRFDLPFLRTRAVYYNLDFPIYKEILHQDVYHIIKNRFLIHKNRLETACRFFNIPCKSHPLKPDIWFEAMGGKKKALDYILEHNKEDVISLEALWKKVNFYSQYSKRSI